MPQIVFEHHYDGATKKVSRLGLSSLLDELRERLTGFRLQVEETKGANGGGALRKLLDKQFESDPSWIKTTVGGIDYTKCIDARGIKLCLGVEIQVSARSDLIAVDLLHLKQALRGGLIDVGVLVVPSDLLSTYLPSRFPSVTEAQRIFDNFDAESLPLILWGLEHDGPGKALPVRGRS